MSFFTSAFGRGRWGASAGEDLENRAAQRLKHAGPSKTGLWRAGDKDRDARRR
jgi:hypothetical protein